MDHFSIDILKAGPFSGPGFGGATWNLNLLSVTSGEAFRELARVGQ